MMFRVAVIQNQSESFRSGYADVARNLSRQLRIEGYSFVPIDGSNIIELFEENSEIDLFKFDSIIISTNALSDEITKNVILKNQDAIGRFLSYGRGIFLGYQKKLSTSLKGDINSWLLPEPFRIRMDVRPKDETDSSQGTVTSVKNSKNSVAPFLILNNPNEISDQLIENHCRDNDFKYHTYRSILVPENEATFETVLEDLQYGSARRLMLVNRTSFSGERLVISSVVIDWEGHWKLLENVVRYITEGIPTVALYSHPKIPDTSFEFLRSSARILRIPHIDYFSLDVPSDFRGVHNVFLLSSKWEDNEVLSFWEDLAGPEPKSLREAAEFKRLYQLGDGARSHTSLKRFMNYTAIDVIANEALVWLERQFSGGLWSGSFWATHDILKTYVSLGMDVSSFLPGVLKEIEPHLITGGYDAVMGPSCGLLSLLNCLSLDYECLISNSGFGVNTRADIALWILDNLESQSDVARQVAAHAMFGTGSAKTLSELERRGKARNFSLLRSTVTKALLASAEQISSLSDIDLVRFIQLSHSNPTLDAICTSSTRELSRRQGGDGLWNSIALTSLIIVTLIDSIASAKEPRSADEATRDLVARSIEGVRARFHSPINPWGGVLQDVALALQALGLYRASYDVGSQEIFESLEAESRLARESVSIGKIRTDLKELFARDLAKEIIVHRMEEDIRHQRMLNLTLTHDTSKAKKSMSVFRILGGVSSLLLIALVTSLFIGEREALFKVIASTGSLLGIVVGALIAVPITYIVTPNFMDKADQKYTENKK